MADASLTVTRGTQSITVFPPTLEPSERRSFPHRSLGGRQMVAGMCAVQCGVCLYGGHSPPRCPLVERAEEEEDMARLSADILGTDQELLGEE